jgi:hypothetical protein
VGDCDACCWDQYASSDVNIALPGYDTLPGATKLRKLHCRVLVKRKNGDDHKTLTASEQPDGNDRWETSPALALSEPF